VIRPDAGPGELHRNGGPAVLVVHERPQDHPTPLPEHRLPTTHEIRRRHGRLDVLLFRVADESFAIDLSAVEEAIDIPPVHHVPEMPHAMLGVITVRGTLTAVYSPAAALGVGLHDGTSALIFRRGQSRLAVVVDEVDDVIALDLSLLRDTPTLEANDGTVLGVVRQGDALLALVDADALLAACQAVPLLETA
jgi:purine-binding chemotaxis protein CheW